MKITLERLHSYLVTVLHHLTRNEAKVDTTEFEVYIRTKDGKEFPAANMEMILAYGNRYRLVVSEED